MAVATSRVACGCEARRDPTVTDSQLNAVLVEAGLAPLDAHAIRQFQIYLSLILRWNEHLNLTAIRTEDAILFRHLAESIACARALPPNLSTLLDFGSGGGFPGIPIALCRPEIAVTLAESQGKKAAFLHEAVRVLAISATVHAGRAETLKTLFDCVTLRAVDKMPKAIATAVKLVAPGGWLAVMTTTTEVAGTMAAAGAGLHWCDPVLLPRSESRILALGRRASSF